MLLATEGRYVLPRNITPVSVLILACLSICECAKSSVSNTEQENYSSGLFAVKYNVQDVTSR